MNTHERIDQYRERYLTFRKMVRDHPELKHDGHGPDWKEFGMTQWQATYIQREVDRELNRTGTISC